MELQEEYLKTMMLTESQKQCRRDAIKQAELRIQESKDWIIKHEPYRRIHVIQRGIDAHKETINIWTKYITHLSTGSHD